MIDKNQLKALLPKIILSNVNVAILDELKEKDKAEIQYYICENIGNQISIYYSVKQRE